MTTSWSNNVQVASGWPTVGGKKVNTNNLIQPPQSTYFIILYRYRTQITFSTFRIDFNVIFHRKIVRLQPCLGKNGNGAGAGDGANGNGKDGFASAAGGDDTQSGDSLSSASTLVTVTAAGVALFAAAF